MFASQGIQEISGAISSVGSYGGLDVFRAAGGFVSKPDNISLNLATTHESMFLRESIGRNFRKLLHL